MTILKSILLAAILVLLCAALVPAQDRLQTLSIDFERRMNSERAEAESVATLQGYPIRTIAPDGTVRELKRLNNGIPVYYQTDNVVAGKTISTDKVYPGGVAGYSLTGSGITLGEWDGGGVRMTHQEFGGRVLTSQGVANFHSTHVAGTIMAAGVVPNARGMSFGASLKEFDWTNDMAEMAQQAGFGLRASNHSYGLITGWTYDYRGDSKWAWFGDITVSAVEDYNFGYYSQESQDWDAVAYAAPYYLIVKAAGNDRNEGPSGSVSHWVISGGSWVLSSAVRNRDGNNGYDCISAAGISKNPLVVGAVGGISGGYSNPAGVVMSSFSGWGPTDDGRIKPDIVADGVNLFSTLETADNAYGSMSGTSMATPSVTGSIGLLLEHQKNLHGADSLLASTIKGIIIHTADETGPNPGPDYMYGWGLMNTRKAVDVMTLNNTDGPNSHIREYNIYTGDTVTFDLASNGTAPLKATICWNDIPVGLPPAMIDPPNQILRNDIDLRIIRKSDGAVFYPWKCDPSNPSAAATRTGDNARDNVEQVLVDSPGRTLYTLRLTHKTTIYDPPTRVSLIMTGNANTIGAAVATSEDTVRYSTVPGAAFADSLRVYNTGDSMMVGSVNKDPGSFWLTLTEDSINIPPLDSATIHFSVNGSLWSQWTTYPGSFTFETNDPFRGTLVVPLIATVRGPKISSAPGSYTTDLDSAEIGHDTLQIRNTGFAPLNVIVADSLGALPAWITAEPDTVTIPPGDSVRVALTANALNEPLGDYATTLRVSHNDSTAGAIFIPFSMNIGTRTLFSLGVKEKWNMLSLPIEPVTGVKTALFPSAVTIASGFDGSYYQADTLRTGPGYWMKFPADGTFPIDGYSFKADTIPLIAGWNMVGSLYQPVGVSGVATSPSGILASDFYQYDEGYAFADSIRPGKGYWVKASATGDLFLSLAPGAMPKAAARFEPLRFNGITVRGSAGGSATLYFAAGPAPAVKSALPPRPPAGGFDVRFADETFFTSFGAATDGEQSRTIFVSGAGNELRVTAQLKQDDPTGYFVADASGGLHPLKDGATIVLPANGDGETALRLVAGGEALPTEFALGQNYPNPFNPSTTVSFSLPTDETVSIRLFNVLGNEVATISSRKYGAGRHEVEFKAENLPSGVYIYTMQAGPFTASRKMVLMR